MSNDPKKTITVAAQLIRIEAATMEARAAILLEDIDEFLSKYSQLQQLIINLNTDISFKLESNSEYFLATPDEAKND